MLACGYVRVMETVVIRDLEEDAMVHAAKDTFEVGVCGIDVMFGEFSVFILHYMGG